MRGITDVEELALGGEDAVDLAAYHGQARYGQCLGGVPLGDNEDAVLYTVSCGVVGVIQLGDVGELGLLRPSLALEGNMTETTTSDFSTSLRNLPDNSTEEKAEGRTIVFSFI